MPVVYPDRYFSRITCIDVRTDIVERGFTHVLLDVDNTILTRDTHEVPDDVFAWLSEARESGLKMCLLSNNFDPLVYELSARLELPIVARAIKPLPHAYLMARRKIGAKRRGTLVIGDQLITDVFGAHFLGMPAYLLRPLVKHDLIHTLILRKVEGLIMGSRLPEDVQGADGGADVRPRKRP